MNIDSPLSLENLISDASDFFKLAPDSRKEPDYFIDDTLLSALGMFFFQEPSLREFQMKMQADNGDNNLHTLFGVSNIPKTSQFKRIIDAVKPDVIFPIFDHYFKLLSRSKLTQRFQVLSGRYLCVIDGSEYFTSNASEKPCDKCMPRERNDGTVQYYHQILQPVFVKYGLNSVIPFMPEEICMQDGSTKNDCEVNAAKRVIKKLRESHPHLDIVINADDIYSRVPMIECVLLNKMSFIFVAKETSHKFMYEEISALRKLKAVNRLEKRDVNGDLKIFEWCENVPLTSEMSCYVNWFSCRILDKNGEQKYYNAWVSNILPKKDNIEELSNSGRAKWKVENETFNILKNYGYHLEHNYGHGKINLAFNFVLLNLLAFFIHIIQRLANPLFQLARAKARTAYNFFEKLRSAIDFFVWESWDTLFDWVFLKRKPVRGPP